MINCNWMVKENLGFEMCNPSLTGTVHLTLPELPPESIDPKYLANSIANAIVLVSSIVIAIDKAIFLLLLLMRASSNY